MSCGVTSGMGKVSVCVLESEVGEARATNYREYSFVFGILEVVGRASFQSVDLAFDINCQRSLGSSSTFISAYSNIMTDVFSTIYLLTIVYLYSP